MAGLIGPASAAIDHDLVPGVSRCRPVLRKRLLHLEQVPHRGYRVHQEDGALGPHGGHHQISQLIKALVDANNFGGGLRECTTSCAPSLRIRAPSAAHQQLLWRFISFANYY